jgi:hypothetical protein
LVADNYQIVSPETDFLTIPVVQLLVRNHQNRLETVQKE